MSIWDFFSKKKQPPASPAVNINIPSLFWSKFLKELPRLQEQPAQQAITPANDLLNEFYPDLVIEFENNADGTYSKLVFSANGIREHFPEVMLVVNQAPAMDGIKVVAFRERAKEISNFALQMNGISLSCDDILICAQPYQGRIELDIAFNKEAPTAQLDDFKNIAYICLDHTLGEFDFAIKVGAVSFVEKTDTETFVPLTQFTTIFDEMWINELGHNQQFPDANEQWASFELKNNNDDDKVAVFGQINLSAQSVACRADLGTCLTVHMNASNKELLNRIYSYEEEISQQLRPLQEGLLVLILLSFRDMDRAMTWYVSDPDKARQIAEQTAQKYPDLTAHIEVTYEPTWDSYLRWTQ